MPKGSFVGDVANDLGLQLPALRDRGVRVVSEESYELSGDEHFSLAVQAGPGGDQRPELVCWPRRWTGRRSGFHELVLRASDGGDPALDGHASRIRVTVVVT
ncbi:hypothetical protein DUI87_27001 [Hirundo rustica rustica]|uniref:Cadherin N-terminal domain-containing protein n=1 Tax=Hirundo rustica rustica TaxID=333673 RepID=A0A3M0J9J7_HIRRU|nr:hypothetical protein DUI87_27001 [Hirundo rustica rustica]